MKSGHSISLIRDPARGTSQLYLSVVWTSAFKKFFQSTTLPSPPLHSKLGCLLFSTGSSNSGTTLDGEEVVKRPKGPLEHNVCTNFVGDRTFLPADIRQALPRGRGGGGRCAGASK